MHFISEHFFFVYLVKNCKTAVQSALVILFFGKILKFFLTESAITVTCLFFLFLILTKFASY